MALPVFTVGARSGWVYTTTHPSLYAREGGAVSFVSYWELGGSQGRFGLMWNIKPSPGFECRTVHLIASRYPGHHKHRSPGERYPTS